MQGTHLYLRAKDRWNAAATISLQTSGLLRESELLSTLEQRCNVDEIFAGKYLAGKADRSLLRVYHPAKNMVVVSRSYWVVDRLADGRNAVYTTEHVMTDQDADAFHKEPGRALEPSLFEPYDSLVQRAKQFNQGVAFLPPDVDYASLPLTKPNYSLLSEAGLNEQSFCQLMCGLYEAMNKHSHVAIILPQNLRTAWEQNGNNIAEQLALTILTLLPDAARTRFGFVSHWSSTLNGNMIAGMPLVFVHDKESAQEQQIRQGRHVRDNFEAMASSGVLTVDLDGGKYTNIRTTDTFGLFSFIWNNLSDPEKITDFFSFAREQYSDIIDQRPVSLKILESVFSLYLTDKRSDLSVAQQRLIFTTAADVFAGAGTLIPHVENYLARQLEAFLQEPTNPDVMKAVCLLTTTDREPTKHQQLEYSYLLRAIREGTADEEVLRSLAGEIVRSERNADQTLTEACDNLLDDENTSEVPPQAIAFASQLLQTVLPDKYVHEELYQTLLLTIIHWAESYDASTADRAQLHQLTELFRHYLREDASDQYANEGIYTCLLSWERSNNPEVAADSKNILDEEEDCIYKGTINSAAKRRETYQNCLLQPVQDDNAFVDLISVDKAVACVYPRLYRLMVVSGSRYDDRMLDKLMLIYRNELLTVNGIDDPNERMRSLQVFFASRLDCLSALSGKYPDSTSRVLLRTEVCNLEQLKDYFTSPQSRKRICRMVQRWSSRQLLRCLYLNKSIEEDSLEKQQALRSDLYREASEEPQGVERLYATMVLLGSPFSAIANSFRSMRARANESLSYDAILKSFFTFDLDALREIRHRIERSSIIENFQKWYQSELEVRTEWNRPSESSYSSMHNEGQYNLQLDIQPSQLPANVNNRIQKYRSLFKEEEQLVSNHADGGDLKIAAIDCIRDNIRVSLSRFTENDFLALNLKELQHVSQCLSKSGASDQIQTVNLLLQTSQASTPDHGRLDFARLIILVDNNYRYSFHPRGSKNWLIIESLWQHANDLKQKKNYHAANWVALAACLLQESKTPESMRVFSERWFNSQADNYQAEAEFLIQAANDLISCWPPSGRGDNNTQTIDLIVRRLQILKRDARNLFIGDSRLDADLKRILDQSRTSSRSNYGYGGLNVQGDQFSPSFGGPIYEEAPDKPIWQVILSGALTALISLLISAAAFLLLIVLGKNSTLVMIAVGCGLILIVVFVICYYLIINNKYRGGNE